MVEEADDDRSIRIALLHRHGGIIEAEKIRTMIAHRLGLAGGLEYRA